MNADLALASASADLQTNTLGKFGAECSEHYRTLACIALHLKRLEKGQERRSSGWETARYPHLLRSVTIFFYIGR